MAAALNGIFENMQEAVVQINFYMPNDVRSNLIKP